MSCLQPLFELLDQTKSFGMTSWIQTHNGFDKDRLRHSCHDMMIRILKTSDGYLSYRANRSMNRKAIQEDETAITMGKIAAVRRLSTGRGQYVDRSTKVLDRSFRSRVCHRPFDDNVDRSTQSREHCRTVEDIADRSTLSREDRRPFDPPCRPVETQ